MKRVRGWLAVAGLAVMAVYAVSAWSDPRPGTDRPVETTKKAVDVGMGGTIHLDTIDCTGARGVISWVRFATQNACSTAAFLGSTNDSVFSAVGFNMITEDSLSNRPKTDTDGWRPIGVWSGDATILGLKRMPWKSLALTIIRKRRGLSDSATTTNLDTAYVKTRVYY